MISNQNEKRLVITGANSFVGRRLVHAALVAGWHVTALSRNTDWLNRQAHANLRVHAWDVSRSPDSAWLGGAYLCHLAAHIPTDMHDPAEALTCYRVNALATESLLQTSVSAGVRHFVYFSSGNIYAPRDRLVKETDLVYPAYQAPYYLTSKLCGEIYVQYYKRRMRTSILRLSSVYGPGMKPAGAMHTFIRQAAAGQQLVLNNGGRYRADFVLVDDVVQATLALLSRDSQGVFNIGNGRATTLYDLAQAILRVLEKPASLLRVEPVDEGQPTGFSGLDISRAQQALGYAPSSLTDGIGQYVDWLRQEG